jgi:hypothetical protein
MITMGFRAAWADQEWNTWARSSWKARAAPSGSALGVGLVAGTGWGLLMAARVVHATGSPKTYRHARTSNEVDAEARR